MVWVGWEARLRWGGVGCAKWEGGGLGPGWLGGWGGVFLGMSVLPLF